MTDPAAYNRELMAAAGTKISAVKMKPPSNQDGPSKSNLVVRKKTESSTKQTASTVAKSEVPVFSYSLRSAHTLR